jgi:uncharacterized membrane protein YeiH
MPTPDEALLFYLPAAFDLGAVFFFALTGALVAIRRGYDLIGLFAMSFISGLGGGLIRDGLFLQDGPPALTRDWRYLAAVAAGCFVGWIMGNLLERFRRLVAILDAVGLGAYSIVGVSRSFGVGLSIPAAILVGVINACGGSLLRDVVVREEPIMMKPGQLYVVASFVACATFVVLTLRSGLGAQQSAAVSIAAGFLVRMLAIFFDWRTRAVRPWWDDAFGIGGDAGKE